jgi:heat shock protein HslJ
MFCMDGMEIENAVLKAFQETTGYEIDKGCLLLKKGREVLASFTTAK